MKFLKTHLMRALLGLPARAGWRTPFIRILKSAISEHPDNRNIEGQKQITVLALSPEGFRGDLEALAGSGRCRVLVMSSTWQCRMLYVFYREGLRPRDYLNPNPGSIEMSFKKALQSFYRAVLPQVYRYHGIDCVISYHIRVPADVDWGVASQETGFPYIVFYREGLFASAHAMHKKMAVLFDRFGFWGTKLVVHNESCRQLCIDTGLVQREKIAALGCIRMDKFAGKIREAKPLNTARKKVTLFPVSLKEGSKFDFKLLPFFNGVHVALAELAKKFPDVDFVFMA